MIIKQIPNTLKETNFDIGKLIRGKVRDSYLLENKRILVATDRISAFDRVIGTLPFKGEILQAVSNFWFQQTEDIIDNHIIDTIDQNAIIVEECNVLPVEVIIRRFITGSLWRDYETGTRETYGLTFEEGLIKNHRFEEPILTPSTKAEQGFHDEPISPQEILKQNLVEPKLWDEIVEKAIALFKKGEEIAASRGLVLVDTKYEFGLDRNGKLVLVDEVHTPDSSRYWYADSLETGNPKQLDKEYIRQWLIGQNFMGDGEIPTFPEEVVVESVKRYLEIYQIFLKTEPKLYQGDVLTRLSEKLSKMHL